MTTTKTSTKVRIRVFFLSCLFICFLHPSVTILPELDCRNCSKDICGIVFPQIPPCYKYSSLSSLRERNVWQTKFFPDPFHGPDFLLLLHQEEKIKRVLSDDAAVAVFPDKKNSIIDVHNCFEGGVDKHHDFIQGGKS